MRFAALVFAASLAVAAPLFGSSLPAQDLFRRQEVPGRISPPAASAAPDVVRVDVALVESGPEELVLELVPGESRLAYRTAFERTAEGDVVWRGRFAAGDPAYAAITLSVHGGVLVGSLQAPEGRAYLLDPRAAGDWELRTEDMSSFACNIGRERSPAQAKALEAPIEPPSASRGSVAANGEESREVGILVVYTPEAAADFHGRELLVARAFHNVDRLNGAWINSGIEGRAILVGVEEFDPPPHPFFPFNVGSAIRSAKEDARVQALRDERGGDVVSVVIGREGGCGQSTLMSRSLVGPQMAPMAYHALGTQCFSGSTFIHETGHVFGAQHNAANAEHPSAAAFPFSYAHGVDGMFRTVMAYPSACSACYPLDVFSNPRIAIDGEPTGIEGQRDNAQTLSLTMPIVAAFREQAPVPVPFPFKKPAKPTNLVATYEPVIARVSFEWRDNARGETSYEVEMKAPGSKQFVGVRSVEPNSTYAWIDGMVDSRPGTYAFRIVAVSGRFRAASKIVQVHIGPE